MLEPLGYLGEDDHEVTTQGRMLARIYPESTWSPPSASATAVYSTGWTHRSWRPCSAHWSTRPDVDQGRMARMPDGPSEQAQQRLRNTWRQVSLVERDFRRSRPEPRHRLRRGRPRLGCGRPLATVLGQSGLPAGDFVRWVRQVIDMAGQVGTAVGPGDLRRTCREVVDAMRRGVVAFDPDETDTGGGAAPGKPSLGPMSVALRVIPCLDVHDGRVVKGVNFTNLRDAETRSSWPRAYGEQGADELVFLDIPPVRRGAPPFAPWSLAAPRPSSSRSASVGSGQRRRRGRPAVQAPTRSASTPAPSANPRRSTRPRPASAIR